MHCSLLDINLGECNPGAVRGGEDPEFQSLDPTVPVSLNSP